jgi:hypothetical protein
MSFEARYDGQCTFEDCATGIIERGDEVEYEDDDLMHSSCASRARRRNTLPPNCDDCGLHHRGMCE